MSARGRRNGNLPAGQRAWARGACLKNAEGIEGARFDDISRGKYMLYWLTKCRAMEKFSRFMAKLTTCGRRGEGGEGWQTTLTQLWTK